MTPIPDEMMEQAKAAAYRYLRADVRSYPNLVNPIAQALLAERLAAEKRGEERERERAAGICDALGDREGAFAAQIDGLTPIYQRGERIGREAATAIRSGT